MAYFLGENADCPVYIQRYITAVDVLKENSVENVIDFGCSELNFVLRLKRDNYIKKVCAVDIDEELLLRCHVKLKPLNVEYIESMRRENPLTYTVFCGSVAERDERLLGYEAVTCIELIEHLEEEILEKLPDVVFGFVRPKIAIFTTPNSDFNVLFKDFQGFRHWDHKFEWSQKEFKEWCDGILKQYSDYTVDISGIGKGPAGTEHLGCCSQMAVFKLKENVKVDVDKKINMQKCPYKLIAEITYPVKTVIPREDEIFNLAKYGLAEVIRWKCKDTIEDFLEIPLSELLKDEKLLKVCSEESELKDILAGRGEDICTDLEGNFVVKCKINDSSSSDEELSEYENYDFTTNDDKDDNNVVTEDDYWD